MLGDRIRQARERLGQSQSELSRQVSVTPAAVAQWELGLTRPASLRLAVLSKTLEVPLDWLIGGAGKLMPAPAARNPVQLDARLVQEADAAGIDITAQLESRLRELIVEVRRRRWLEEHRGALEDANAFLVRNGLWSDGRRQF